MALSASSPCLKGYLLETDTRWDNISDLCDDRQADELGLEVGNRLFYNPYLKAMSERLKYYDE